MEVKHELRQQVRAMISDLPDEYIAASDNGLFQGVTALSEFLGAQTVMLYYSVGREPGTLRIAETALALGKTVAFPYCYLGGRMEARAVQSLDELVPAMLKIPAPQNASASLTPDEIDLIIVPALTYDSEGFRLGYGGGYYDRYLSGIRAVTVGLARERLLYERLPREEHDIPVKRLITEDRTVWF